MPSSLQFADPEWIHLTWGVLLLAALLVGLQLRGKSALDLFLSQVMQPRLVSSIAVGRRFTALIFFVLALWSLVFAAMRPQWGETIRVMPQVGAQIIVCLDVSKSMLAEDAVPNRLERAKAELVDLLDLLRGEQVGLIAFAGKATVISPMTSDLGFLKLILQNVGPTSVGRGGTRLEEPIRKAIDGFGDAADISRVILLITDGEDHDSFPLEAADMARERGIKVITIGFGDEAGSKIQITDPRTQVRSFVTDSAGNEVISRLDGATLREIALRTEGAYIPAGTGALDLASIHQRHIEPLMRGELASGQQVIREEAYQWPVIVALLCLGLSWIIARSGQRPLPLEQALSSRPAVAALLSLCLFVVPQTTRAQQSPRAPAQPPPAEAEFTNASAPDGEEIGGENELADDRTTTDGNLSAKDEEVDPRATYNQSLAMLDSDPDQAAALLRKARANAGADGEVRFRSAYNLGWVEIHCADALLKDQPKEALAHLHEAADWFRESIRLRPKHNDARHNLEIVMRRAMELADALAKEGERDVAARLDQLIDEQRELIDQAGRVVERIDTSEQPPAADKTLRRDFRGLSTSQRQILSEAQALVKQIAEEIGGLQQKQPDKLDERQRIRAAQLQATAVDLERATQRLGQARSQFRRREAQRGFRRAALALEELKRARDNLRQPQEVLQRMVTDTGALIDKTDRKASAVNDVTGTTAKLAPPWLTKELLEQSQETLTERSRRWAEQMNVALAAKDIGHEETAYGDGDNAQADASPDDLREIRKQRIRPSVDLVERATDRFEAASSQLASDRYSNAVELQGEAFSLLTEALELFLDLRGLIEAAYATEQQIQQFADAWERLSADQRYELAVAFKELQQKNLHRADRIAEEIDFQRQQLAAALQSRPPTAGDPDAITPNADPPQQAAEESRLKMANALLQSAKTNMQRSAAALEQIGAAPNSNDDENDRDHEDIGDLAESRATLVENVAQAVDRLQELRRLFFSIVEHLRETAQRQSDLNDQTQQLTVSDDEESRHQQLGVIGEEQAAIEQVSRQISEALQQQAAQAPTVSADSQQDTQESQQISQKFAQASKLVATAAASMAEVPGLIENARDISEIRAPQDEALHKLAEALALLVPPNEQNDRQNQPGQDRQQENQQQQQQQQQRQQQNMSANQLLQMVRDREAQRRRDRQQRVVAPEPVDKDW